MDAPGLPSSQSLMSIVDGEGRRLQPYSRTSFVAQATVPDGICWYLLVSAGLRLYRLHALLSASLTTGFANHGLTCFAFKVMIACAIGGVYLFVLTLASVTDSFGYLVLLLYCFTALLLCLSGRLDYAAAFSA